MTGGVLRRAASLFLNEGLVRPDSVDKSAPSFMLSSCCNKRVYSTPPTPFHMFCLIQASCLACQRLNTEPIYVLPASGRLSRNYCCRLSIKGVIKPSPNNKELSAAERGFLPGKGSGRLLTFGGWTPLQPGSIRSCLTDAKVRRCEKVIGNCVTDSGHGQLVIVR